MFLEYRKKRGKNNKTEKLRQFESRKTGQKYSLKRHKTTT